MDRIANGSSIARALRGAAFACALSGVAAFGAEPATGFARAEVAANARAAADAIAAVVDAGATIVIVDAIGGPAAERTLALLAGHVFSALGALTAADAEWKRVADFAERDRDPALLGRALGQRVEIALSQGNYALSEDLADDLARVAAASGRTGDAAFSEGNLGVLARRRGQLDAALTHQERALALYRKAGDAAGEAQALANLATVYRDRGDFARALDAALDAVTIRERIDDRRVDIALRNVALLYREIEDIATSRSYFARALDAARRRGEPAAYSAVIGAYAGLLNDAGEFDAAQAAAGEALAIDRALGDRPHQGLEHLELGRALLGRHEIDAAVAELETALSLGRELGQREIVARALLRLADAEMQTHDTLRARARLDEAIAGLETAQLRPQLAQAYAAREQLALAEHDDTEALRYAHKHAAEREILIGMQASRRLAVNETQHARAEAEQRVALLSKDNELQAALLGKQQLERRIGAIALAALGALLLLMLWRFVGMSRLNRALARRNAEIERQRTALGEANRRLEHQAVELYQATITDSMTGIANRAHSLAELARIIDLAHGEGRELAVLLIDFDHFKDINDRHGHLFGDHVLVEGVEAMRRCLRPGDVLGRIGGEEFIAILSDRDADAAIAVAERLRLRVADRLSAIVRDVPDDATVSIGIARLAEVRAPRVECLLEAADEALYAAKTGGRNRVQRYAA